MATKKINKSTKITNVIANKMIKQWLSDKEKQEQKKSQVKTRKENKYVKYKREIIKLLESKGIKENVDDALINTAIFNLKMMDTVEKNLLAGNYISQVRKDKSEPLFQVSAEYTIYNNCFKNYVVALTKLGITPQERSKLKLNVTKESNDDGF